MSIELERIDHIGIAVSDMEAAIALYDGTLGMPVAHRERIESQGVEVALLEVGEGHIELLEPVEEDTPVGRFIARDGEGLHHVAYLVDDIVVALKGLATEGVELIDPGPKFGIQNRRVAFVHHESVRGVLTELIEPPNS